MHEARKTLLDKVSTLENRLQIIADLDVRPVRFSSPSELGYQ